MIAHRVRSYTMTDLTLLLPPRSRFEGSTLEAAVARALGRADRIAVAEAGRRAQLLRHFDLLPRGWPIAAITRQHDARDAQRHAWLRADPAWVRADINAGRMLACGDALALDVAEAEDLLRPLKPLFGDAGFPISAPVPQRWYLMLPKEAKPPAFADPDSALGDDLFEHLPQGPDGRRWRMLLSEAQVILHNHPRNAARAAAGKPPVNSLWFWGGGVLPDRVHTPFATICSNDPACAALAACAGRPPEPVTTRLPELAADTLIDLSMHPDATTPQRDGLLHSWLQPAIERTLGGAIATLVLDFLDGGGYRIERGQRWRLWRRPLATFAP